MREAGASRVSEQAVRTLAKHLEDVVVEKTIKALQLATHADRKTITEKDISACLPVVGPVDATKGV